MKLGINASNIRSGGGIQHIYNLLKFLDKKKNNKKKSIRKIIVWCSEECYQKLVEIRSRKIKLTRLKKRDIFIIFFGKYITLIKV